MFRKSRIAFFVCFAVMPAFLATSCYIRPPKPGAVWVPGHCGSKGRWIDGHWR